MCAKQESRSSASDSLLAPDNVNMHSGGLGAATSSQYVAHFSEAFLLNSASRTRHCMCLCSLVLALVAEMFTSPSSEESHCISKASRASSTSPWSVRWPSSVASIMASISSTIPASASRVVPDNCSVPLATPCASFFTAASTCSR